MARQVVIVGTALALTVLAAVAVGQPNIAPAPALEQRASEQGIGIALPVLRVDVSERGVVLTGTVPDKIERDAIVRRAKSIYGAAKVTSELQIGEVGNPAWLSADFLPDLRDAAPATAVLENATLVIEGATRSTKAYARIAAAVDGYRARGITVENRMRNVNAPLAVAGVQPDR
jgi:hypothetical protein